MKNNKRKNILILLVEITAVSLMILYLVFMPKTIMSRLEENAYNKIFKPDLKNEAFMLDVWHIVEFKPHTGSLNSYFSEYSLEFEKNNKGVFINNAAMTVEEYYERINRGERADVYSFPASQEDKINLLSFEEDETEGLLFNSEKHGIKGGRRTAIPYALFGSFIVGNSELLQKKNMEFTLENIENLRSNMGDNEQFLNKKECLTIADVGTLGSMERKYESGKGFRIDALPLKENSEQLQLLGVAADIQEKKKDTAFNYIMGLNNAKWVEKLCKMGVIPTVKCDEAKIEFQNSYVRAYYEMIIQN